MSSTSGSRRALGFVGLISALGVFGTVLLAMQLELRRHARSDREGEDATAHAHWRAYTKATPFAPVYQRQAVRIARASGAPQRARAPVESPLA